MQHLYMDFKEFSPDKYSYDSILVFINRLGKDLVTILYYKTINIRDIATLFI